MKLLFLGDFLFDYAEPQADVAELGRRFAEGGYVAVLNLEAPLRARRAKARPIVLFQSDGVIDALRTLGVQAVNLANNHVLDWGEEGLTNLRSRLEAAGIAAFGAGADLQAATRLQSIRVGEQSVGLLGYGWEREWCVPARPRSAGVAPLRAHDMLRAVRAAKSQVDRVVVNLHWGYEYELHPLPVHRRLARELVEAGADLVIGHHPHVVQPFEVHRGKPIYYSLGNFYFGSRRRDFMTLNEIAAGHSQLGLGVGWDPVDGRDHRLFFRFDGRQTSRCADEPLQDLGAIPMDEYDAYFLRHRTAPWKPALLDGDRVANRLRALEFDARLALRDVLSGNLEAIRRAARAATEKLRPRA